MKPIVEMELVYSLHIEDGFAYAVAKVALFSDDHEEFTVVKVDRMVKPVELDEILKSFESDILERIGMALDEDYKVIVEVNGVKYEPIFSDKHKVLALEKKL